jgi:segregation and condensation protein B
MTDLTPEPDDSGEPLADATPSGAAETGDGSYAELAEEAAPAREEEPFDGAAEPGALFDAPEGATAEPPLRAGLEAILLVVDEPVPEVMLAQILERPRDEVAATLRELAAEYTEQARGFDLREIAGGWRFYTRDVCAPLVERFVRDGQAARLTQAALETLAVIAYRQPVSRARVSAIRGVNSDGVIRTLTMRGLIEEAGHDPEHQAVLYRTTTYFLERLGLNTVDELPELAPYLPDDLEGIEELQQ